MQNYPNLFNKVPTEPQIQTNKWVVTSLTEALARPAPPNSTGVYFSQDGEYEYEITTDANGIKNYDTYKRSLCSKEEFVQIPTDDYRYLLAKMAELETKINGKPTTSSSTCSSEVQGSSDGKLDTK